MLQAQGWSLPLSTSKTSPDLTSLPLRLRPWILSLVLSLNDLPTFPVGFGDLLTIFLSVTFPNTVLEIVHIHVNNSPFNYVFQDSITISSRWPAPGCSVVTSLQCKVLQNLRDMYAEKFSNKIMPMCWWKWLNSDLDVMIIYWSSVSWILKVTIWAFTFLFRANLVLKRGWESSKKELRLLQVMSGLIPLQFYK